MHCYIDSIESESFVVKFLFLFTDRIYLALDWDPDMKKLYFDENAAEVRSLEYTLLIGI